MVDTLKSCDYPPSIRFCIPDQWFRRKPRSSSSQSHSSASTDAGNSADEDGEGTARQSKSSAGSSTHFTAPVPGSPEWRGSVAQSRLTNFLAGWSQPAPATTSAVIATPAGKRKSVSEPLLVQHNTGGCPMMGENVRSGDVDSEEFERCLVGGDSLF